MKVKAFLVIILLMTGYIFGQDTSIVIKSPNGGEKWLVGTSRNITWTRNDTTIVNVKIESSFDNGSSWGIEAPSVAASLGTYAWIVPNSQSDQCLIRISNVDNATIFGVSKGVFTIQLAKLVTLRDINIMPDSTTGWPNSHLAGDTVRVQGSVLVRPLVDPATDRRAILYFGAAIGTYVEEADGSDWSGLNVYQADSTAYATGFDLCDTASTYEFTGIVTPYGMGTELMLITSPTPIPVNLISQETSRPAPKVLTLDSCFNADGSFNVKLRKYYGMYVSFQPDSTHPNLITSNLITTTGSTGGGFKIDNGNGRMIQVYAQSKYFKTGPSYTLRPSYVPFKNGTYMSSINGLLEAYANTWEVVPVYPNDLGPYKQAPPTISNCKRDIAVVAQNTPVTIKANCIGDKGAFVTTAQLFFSINGVQDSLTMTKGVADTTQYSATIPGIADDSAFVEYYVKATDNVPLSSTSPGTISNSRFSFFVLSPSKPFSIQHVRYSPFGSGYSGYNGYPVTVTGVVTADTSSIPGSGANNPPRIFIQNGSTPWSGIILGYKGTVSLSTIDSLQVGDMITVSGTPVLSSSSGTRLDTLTALTVLSHGNSLPEAHVMKTSDVGFSALGNLVAEPWNSCLVKYSGVTVDSANADGTYNYGESYVTDSSGGNHTRVTWSDGRTVFFAGATAVSVNKGDKFGSITGILGYTHTNYKLCPRNDHDIVGFINDVKNNQNVLPTAYKLNQNYPNPFNPSTIISYELPKTGLVTIRIFNILGQQVRTLVNETQNAGSHQISFNANSLSSGIYFYSLTVNNYSQVKKMMLIK